MHPAPRSLLFQLLHKILRIGRRFYTWRISTLHPSTSSLFLAFITFSPFINSLSAQSYTSIPPQHEIFPVDLHTTKNIGLMGTMNIDPDGYLWITTTRGVLVFDGNNSIFYDLADKMFAAFTGPEKPEGFAGLQKSKDGNLYTTLSPANAVLTIDSDKRSVIKQINLQEKAFKYFFDVSDDGDIYTLSQKENADTFSIYKLTSYHEKKLIYTFSSNKTGEVFWYSFFDHHHWIETTKGILRISQDGAKSTFYSFGNTIGLGWNLLHDDQNLYFFDASQQAIMSWKKDSEHPKTFAHFPDYLNTLCNYFYVDHEKLFLAGGTNFVMIDTLNKTIEDISEQYFDLKANYIPGALSEDLHGMQWIDGQPFILTNRNLYTIREIPPPVTAFRDTFPGPNSRPSMRGLAEDENQNVYASYYTGIVFKAKGEGHFKSLPLLKNLNTELYSAYNLTYHDHHLYWHTLSINLDTKQIYPLIPNVTKGHVTQLLTGNTLWLFTWYTDHLYKYDIPNRHLDSVKLEEKPLLSSGYPLLVNTMVESSDTSAIWLATRMNGIALMRKDGKIMKHYPHEFLGANLEEGICDIYLQGDLLWFGCYEGLGVLNTKTGEHIIYKDQLTNADGIQKFRTVFSMLPDQTGFYLGTSRGLVYFETKSKKYLHLPADHPLSNIEYNRTSAFKDSRGRYYFGTTNGLFSFMADELKFMTTTDSIRPIRLYSISIFNGNQKKYRYLTTDLENLKSLSLNPSETNINFFFSVADFSHPIYYSYRIHGLNEQWSDFTLENHILLNALPPGNYMLEVRASSNASEENASAWSVVIHMPAYWYQRAWVILLFILLISGLVISVIRYQFQQKWKRQKALESLRVKISSDLHDDVGSILSGLAMQSQVMSYEVEEGKRKPLLELSEMSREAMERMRDTVWAIDARKDKFENLLDRMRDFAEKNLERKNVSHTFTVSGLDIKKFINPEVRQNIYLIFKEAITNVVRHSTATQVDIRFLQDGENLKLIIHDNGIAKIVENNAGQGISNMKMRAERIGGKLKIDKGNGYCTELNLSIR